MGSKTGYNTEELDVNENSTGANYRLTSDEREVVIIMDDKDRKWRASCSSPTYIRKFERQGWTCTGTEYYQDGAIHTKFFEAPTSSAITIGKAERPKRQGKSMSEEHKKKLQDGRAAKKIADSSLS